MFYLFLKNIRNALLCSLGIFKISIEALKFNNFQLLMDWQYIIIFNINVSITNTISFYWSSLQTSVQRHLFDIVNIINSTAEKGTKLPN